jgi:hypothetical protein
MAASSSSRAVQILSGILSVAGCAWMCALLLRTWVDPMAVEGGRWVALGVGIMVMEFILVHSGTMIAGAGMMGPSPWKLVLALVGLYSLFGLAIAFAFDSMLLLGTFAAIMIPRVMAAVSPSSEARTLTLARSGISAMLYLVVAFVSVLVPFPEGGLDSSVLNAVYPDRGDGEWEREPQRALAAGALYFGVLALVELGVLVRQSKGGTVGASLFVERPPG